MAGEDHSIFEDDGSNYMASVSDIMTSLLFVFIITLVAFVIQFQDAEQRVEVEHEWLTNNRAMRNALLEDIEDELRQRGVQVKIDLGHGVLRLTEETVRFRSGSTELDEVPKRNLDLISEVLANILPCYAKSDVQDTNCNSNTVGRLDAVFIEGHTDNVPLKSAVLTNWDLSVKRAIVTYQHMLARGSMLGRLTNGNDEPLFSVAGYADQRPLVGHKYEGPTPDSSNRRIDIRFIMTPPTAREGAVVERLHEAGLN